MRSQILKKILIIDDEEDIRTVACMALELVGGFEVGQAESGEHGVTMAPAFRPDVIMLDVMMPGLDGPATFSHLRSNPDLVDIPVIFMTGKVQPEEVAELFSMGACGVIAKPFEAMKLSEQIQEIWNAGDVCESRNGR